MSQPDLVEAWRDFSPGAPPHILRGDEAILEPTRYVEISSIPEFFSHPEFDFIESPSLHLGLHPLPYSGDLKKADIFILLQNPGFHPSDYFAELSDLAFLNAKIGAVRQEFADPSFPFPSLDPRFSYHAGYEYWRRKLNGVLFWLAKSRSISVHESLRLLSQRVAILELVPYHSTTAKFRSGTLDQLRSVRLVRAFVNEELVPRAEGGQAVLIVTRQGKVWGLEESENVIVYGGSEARSAHLSPRSRGGSKIIERLGLEAPAF